MPPNITFSCSYDDGHSEWITERAEEYERLEGLQLVHAFQRSASESQLYQVVIFLVRHTPGSACPQQRGLNEVERVEFYPGSAWGDRVFVCKNTGGSIGMVLDTFGSFLMTARLRFKDDGRAPEILHRYIDFHQAQTPPKPSELVFFPEYL